MEKILKFIPAFLLSLMVAGAAFGQSGTFPAKVQQPWYQQGKISGGISVSNTSGATALPVSSGFTAWICNTGSNDAYLAFGSSNAVVATTTGSSWLKASTCANYDLFPSTGITAPFSYIAAITASSTTTLAVETGSGTGPAQLASGGGGSTSVTQGTTPWVDNITQWGSATLGAASAWGVAPTGNVPGFNANIVASVALPVTGTFWQATQPVSGTFWQAIQPVSGTIQPSAASSSGLTPSSTVALASSQIVKASAGNLYSFEVSADSTLSGSPWWIMIFNATTLPADGAVTPTKCYAMSSGQTSAAYAWMIPVQFSTGIVIGVSTTGCFTKTASVHAFISGDAQ